MSEIPPNAAEIPFSEDNRTSESAELRLLDVDGKQRDLRNKESSQRIWVKWLAIGTGIFVIIAMLYLIFHITHAVLWGPFIVANTAFSVVMIVAPITSITTITVAIFIGAFRKFDDKDIDNAGTGAMNLIGSLRQGQ